MPERLEEDLAARAKKNDWVAAGEDGELPEVCRSCQCRTCGNEGCASECWKDPKAVSGCEFIGATGDGCSDFRIKEEDTFAPEPVEEPETEEGPAELPKTPAPAPGGDMPAPVSAPDVPETAPAGFDYSTLAPETAEHLQNLARRAVAAKQRYILDMMEIVSEAHRELCGTVVARCDNGTFGKKDDTFRAWCASIGVGKDTAYRLLQVQALMDDSTPEEQEVLADAPAKLLYAAAKPSAPAELVQAVKDGDITTNKQYQEALAQLKAKDTKITELIEYSEAADRRADAAEQRAREAAAQHAAIAKDCNRLGLQAEKAEDRAKQAEKALVEIRKERDGARDALQAAKLRGDRLKEENEALKARPIEASVVDSDEVDRLVAKRVEDVLTSQNIRQQEEQEQAAQDAYDAFILTARSLDNLWQTLKPQVARLDPDQKRGAVNLLLQKLMEVKEDLIHVCENHAV